MPDNEIIGLGLANVDVVMQRSEMPTWENPGVTTGFTLADGGQAGTACAVSAMFGVPSGFIDTIGEDDMADRKRGKLVEAGVDVSRLAQREGPEDHVFIVFVQEQTGERFFSFVKGFLAQPLQPEELDRDYITAARYLHLDAMHSQAAMQAAKWMHEAGKQVVLDASATDRPVPDYMRELVGETDILICGSGFGPMLTGEQDLYEAGRAALALGPQVVVQTEGVDGSYTVTKDEEFHVPSFEVDAIDTCGAGDVFHGAYLVGLVKGWDLKRIATFSSAVSAIHCTVLGNRKGIPSMEEVETFLRERG
jgi:ribokinase